MRSKLFIALRASAISQAMPTYTFSFAERVGFEQAQKKSADARNASQLLAYTLTPPLVLRPHTEQGRAKTRATAQHRTHKNTGGRHGTNAHAI